MTDTSPALRATSSEAPPHISAASRLGPVENFAVRLLASAAAFIALACAVLLLNGGPSKELDTGLWVLAFAVALPLGTYLGARQARRLAAAPEPVARWALAIGALLLMIGLLLRRFHDTGNQQLALLGLLAVAAYGVIELVARRPAVFGRLEARPGWAPLAVGICSIAIMIAFFFAPRHPFPSLARIGVKVTVVVVLAGLALAAVHAFERRTPRSWRRRLFDVGLCVVLVMVVFEVKLPPPAQAIAQHETFVLHENFYLGPVNAIAHGRTMLVDIWAQYGVGVYYALLGALHVLPLNRGGLLLLVSTLMSAQYAIVYATLRAAIRSQALVIAAVVAAVMANIFANLGAYGGYPSIGPLRFGPPYLVVAAAVAAARWPQHARAMRVGQLVVIAIAAVWSFETFVYTAATWFALAALRAFGRSRAGVRVFVRELVAVAAVSVGAVLALTIVIRVVAGAWPDWSGYWAYISLYSEGEFGTLPLDFWSPGLVMAAFIFLSAVGVVSVARDERVPASGPALAGLAGFTGFAASTFTYFLGRSHPNNLLNLILPVCALGALWASIFLAPGERDRRAWRMVPVALTLVVAASLTVFGFPGAVRKWPLTAFAHAVPFADGDLPGRGQSLRASLADVWAGRTYDDSIVDHGAALLQRYDPGDGPALVVLPENGGSPPQTTGILLRVRRGSLLPIGEPEQDNLILPFVWPRIAAAIDAAPDGTILLTLPMAQSNPPLVQRTLEELRRRFNFEILESSPDSLQVIRLHPRR